MRDLYFFSPADFFSLLFARLVYQIKPFAVDRILTIFLQGYSFVYQWRWGQFNLLLKITL